MSIKSNLFSWQVRQAALHEERQIKAFLNDVSRLPKNNSELLTPVKIKCLKPFCIKGKTIEPGQVVEVERFVAEDMIFLKKAEYV